MDVTRNLWGVPVVIGNVFVKQIPLFRIGEHAAALVQDTFGSKENGIYQRPGTGCVHHNQAEGHVTTFLSPQYRWHTDIGFFTMRQEIRTISIYECLV